MNTAPFVYGFLAALILMVIALSALYLYLRGCREKQAKIKGYLDLIPDLTENQRAKLQAIRHVFLPKVERIRQEMRLKRAELAELLFSEPSDRTRIYEVAETIIDSQSKLEQEVIEHILEEKELLTLSQKQKFYEIIVEQFSGGGLGVHDVRAQNSKAEPARKRCKA